LLGIILLAIWGPKQQPIRRLFEPAKRDEKSSAYHIAGVNGDWHWQFRWRGRRSFPPWLSSSLNGSFLQLRPTAVGR
jgi:hypothetical protein